MVVQFQNCGTKGFSVLFSKSGGLLSRGNSGDADAYGTVPGTDGRRTVRIQIGGTSERSGGGGRSNEGSNSFQPAFQAQQPLQDHISTYQGNQTPTASNVTVCRYFKLLRRL